jgi:hypothetical protein
MSGGARNPLEGDKQSIKEGKGEKGNADEPIYIKEGHLEPLQAMTAHGRVLVPEKHDNEQDAQVVQGS